MFPRVDGLRSIEFGTPGPSRTNLVNLVLHGAKRATAGLRRDYDNETEELLSWFESETKRRGFKVAA